jgi:hypothetical protein
MYLVIYENGMTDNIKARGFTLKDGRATFNIGADNDLILFDVFSVEAA